MTLFKGTVLLVSFGAALLALSLVTIHQTLTQAAESVKQSLVVTVFLQASLPDAQDKLFSEEVAALCRHTVRLREWEEPEELLQWIHEYSLVVGMRYHALALAALAGKPFIGWGFQRKVQTLCRDYKQPFWPFEQGWEEDAIFAQIEKSIGVKSCLTALYSPRQ